MIVYHFFFKKAIEKGFFLCKYFYKILIILSLALFFFAFFVYNIKSTCEGGFRLRFEDICKKLADAGIENCETEALLLLEKFCAVTPASLPLRKKEDFTLPELINAVERRAERYPLQYILGEWYFYSEKYIVNESCLVPRPDTEILVETAVNNLPQNAVFADLCTGSGCIAISVLANRADCRTLAVELYEDTLALAEKNAELNGVSERFFPLRADVLYPLQISAGSAEPPFDAILSNPPYIRSDVINSLQKETLFEPRMALDGGEDGLIFYRAILTHHAQLLKENGFIAFEIGYDQAALLKELALSHSFTCEIIKDLGGNDRVALLRKNI